MKFLRQWAAVALLATCGSSALAQLDIHLASGDSRSAFRDTSNIGFGDGLQYRVNLFNPAGDPDVYINEISLAPDANWNANINLQAPSTDFEYNFGGGTYTMGTAISGANNWNFAGAFRNGAIDPSVADGIYTTTLNFLGGADSSATDTLASFGLTLQVAQKLDIGVTLAGSPDIIGQGQATQVSMTVTNNMTGLNFVSTTWFVSGYSNGTDQLIFDNFTYTPGWFNRTVAPGDSLTDEHSTWSAAANQVGGDYFGNNGVVGGLYNGDFYFVGNSPQSRIGVVPAPSSVLSLLVGAGLLAPIMIRRKRLAK